MRVFGLALGRGARPSGPDGCASCSTGISVARAQTDRAPRVIQVWDGGGSGSPAVPDGGGGNPAPSGQWGENWARSHWAPDAYYGFWGPPSGWGGPYSTWGGLIFHTAATVTGARCGILTQNGAARTEAGVANSDADGARKRDGPAADLPNPPRLPKPAPVHLL